jgi:DNA polymerase delta subunit 4
MPRLRRWKRAQTIGLHPPLEVLAVLLREQEDGNIPAQRAYMDELLNSKFGDVV